MADADLEQIRAARLEQLKAQSGSSNQSGDSKQPSSEQSARASLLSQLLAPAGLDRLNRIRLVKPSRATEVEDQLLMMGKRGMLRHQVTEEELKDLLAQLSEREESTSGGGGGVGKIVVSRRKGWDSDDDDDLEGLVEGGEK